MIRRALIAFAALMMILPSAGGLLAQRKVPPKTVDPDYVPVRYEADPHQSLREAS